jgi:hypothetical protein
VFNLRIADHVKDQLRELATAHKRTLTAEANDLIERGIDFRRMLEKGGNANLLFDLFAAGAHAKNATDWVDILRLHFRPEELRNAVLGWNAQQ